MLGPLPPILTLQLLEIFVKLLFGKISLLEFNNAIQAFAFEEFFAVVGAADFLEDTAFPRFRMAFLTLVF